MKYLFLLALALLLSCSRKPPEIVIDTTTGLVVNISFDGNVVDSVSGVEGIIHNATFATDRHEVAGKAMYFNSLDSATVNFGVLPMVSPDSTNHFTICCWIKVSDTSAPMAVLSKRGLTGPFEYSMDNHFNYAGFTFDNWISSGQTSVYGTDPLNASAPVQPGQWQHIAYVADGSTLKVYVNGVLQTGIDQHNSNYSFSQTAANLVIGNGGGYGRNYYFNGCIDDIKIYNRALTSIDVKELASE